MNIEIEMHRWYAIVKQDGKVIAVIGHTQDGLCSYESVEAWEYANT